MIPHAVISSGRILPITAPTTASTDPRIVKNAEIISLSQQRQLSALEAAIPR
jgi:hypothetical protein